MYRVKYYSTVEHDEKGMVRETSLLVAKFDFSKEFPRSEFGTVRRRLSPTLVSGCTLHTYLVEVGGFKFQVDKPEYTFKKGEKEIIVTRTWRRLGINIRGQTFDLEPCLNAWDLDRLNEFILTGKFPK